MTLTSYLKDVRIAFPPGSKNDRRYEVVSPESDEDSPLADSDALFASDVAIDEVGLARGNRFTYLYDFGDQHLFLIEVVEIQPGAAKGVKYPHTIAREGKNPRQYREWG